MVKRQWWKQDFQAQVVLIDECHLTAFSAVVQQMMTQTYPNAIYIGLTATPYRLKKTEEMGDIFQTLVAAPMPHKLIDSGYLSKPSYYGLHQPDLQKVKTVAGDYDEHQLAIACDKPELIDQLVGEWRKLAYGRRTIVFAVNVALSQNKLSLGEVDLDSNYDRQADLKIAITGFAKGNSLLEIERDIELQSKFINSLKNSGASIRTLAKIIPYLDEICTEAEATYKSLPETEIKQLRDRVTTEPNYKPNRSSKLSKDSQIPSYEAPISDIEP